MKRKFLCVIEAATVTAPVQKITIEVEAEDMGWAKHYVESEFPTFESLKSWRWLKLEEIKT